MESLKNRNEIDIKDKWDLTKMFSSYEEVNDKVKELEDYYQELLKMKGHILDNKDTLKITFPNRKISILKFRIKEEEKMMLEPNGGILTITAIGKCALNHFNGNITPQILLEDFEITNRQKWDF